MPSRTHRNVVIGVTLLAAITLFSVFFWIGIGISTAIAPIDADDRLGLVTIADYLTGGRIFMGIAVGVIGTVGAWVIADSAIE